MTRWRPPPQKSSPYITASGAAALRAEFKTLWRETRPEVVQALSAAAAEGDRSENAEYVYRKKQLAEMDRRIQYLTRRLEEIKIVDRLPEDQGLVRFGAEVTLVSEEGEFHYRIVGADETNAQKGWISIDSPVARALLGKRVGETFQIGLPVGQRVLSIMRVSYRHF